MKGRSRRIVVVAAACFIMALRLSCSSGAVTPYNPASDRIGSQAGIPPEPDTPGGGVLPNVAPFVEASRLAAANTEAGNVRTAVRGYLNDHPAASSISSDDLQPTYLSGRPQAKYTISAATLSIVGVYATGGGWRDIVFSLSQQRWVKGAPDMDHQDDQDVP